MEIVPAAYEFQMDGAPVACEEFGHGHINSTYKITTDTGHEYVLQKINKYVFHNPVQLMANRSDLPGGSTLGSIAGTLVPVSTVDIGLAQLAMHSSWETMGAQDCAYLAAAAARIFETEL